MKQAVILFVALSLTAIRINAQQTKVVLDNEKMKITEYISQPGGDVCGAGKHTHGDHSTILVTDARVKTINAEGKTEMETYSAGQHLYTVVKDGKTEKVPTDGAFWVTGTSHSVTNVGNKPMRFYIIELK